MPVPTPQVLAASLLVILEDTTFNEAMPVLETLHSQGLLDFSMPIASTGSRSNSFLYAWLSKAIAARDYGGPTAAEHFDTLERWSGNPRWLAEANGFKKKSLFDLWMDRHSRANCLYPHDANFLARAPLDLILEWTSDGNRHQNQAPGAAFLDAILTAQSPSYACETANGSDFIPQLVARGLKLTGQVEDAPLAMAFRQPGHWTTFLSQGGDPQQKVKDKYDLMLPLWQALFNEHKGQPLGETIEKTMTAIDPSIADANEKEALRQYWIKAKAYNPSINIRSRKNWATLHNDQGQNVLMVVLENGREQAFKDLSGPKMAKPLFLETDAQGRGLWHYAIQQSASEEIQKLLLDSGAVAHPDSQGRGFLLQGPLDNEGLHKLPNLWNQKFHSEMPPDWIENPAYWLAGPPEEQSRMCDYLINGRDLVNGPRSFPDENDKLSDLAHGWTAAHDIGPHWRGALCINEICTSNPDWTWLNAQIALGAIFILTLERAAKIQKWVSYTPNPAKPKSGDLQKMQAGIQSMVVLRHMEKIQLDLPERADPIRRRVRP